MTLVMIWGQSDSWQALGWVARPANGRRSITATKSTPWTYSNGFIMQALSFFNFGEDVSAPSPTRACILVTTYMHPSPPCPHLFICESPLQLTQSSRRISTTRKCGAATLQVSTMCNQMLRCVWMDIMVSEGRDIGQEMSLCMPPWHHAQPGCRGVDLWLTANGHDGISIAV